MKYVCDVCGWIYDEAQGAEEHGIAPGTKWDNVPESFSCPLCNVGKKAFSKEEVVHQVNVTKNIYRYNLIKGQFLWVYDANFIVTVRQSGCRGRQPLQVSIISAQHPSLPC